MNGNTKSGPWNPQFNKVIELPPWKKFKPLKKKEPAVHRKRATHRRSVNLTLAQWIALLYIAANTESFARAGIRKGKPSWRTLLTRIADGELVCIPRTMPENP